MGGKEVDMDAYEALLTRRSIRQYTQQRVATN